jgi:hypothetical protein
LKSPNQSINQYLHGDQVKTSSSSGWRRPTEPSATVPDSFIASQRWDRRHRRDVARAGDAAQCDAMIVVKKLPKVVKNRPKCSPTRVLSNLHVRIFPLCT